MYIDLYLTLCTARRAQDVTIISMMRSRASRIFTIIALTGVVSGLVYFVLGNRVPCSVSSETVIIYMNEGGFEPVTSTIKQCTEVIFQNNGSQDHWPASDLHPTHLTYPQFDPQMPIESGKSWSFIFDRIGKWKCHDHLQPGLRCVIEVIP